MNETLRVRAEASSRTDVLAALHSAASHYFGEDQYALDRIDVDTVTDYAYDGTILRLTYEATATATQEIQ